MTQDQHAMRHLLRQYLLDTLDAATRNTVDRQLAVSEEWRNALEAERAALTALDALPDAAPPPDLAAKTMGRVRFAEHRQRQKVSFRFAPTLEIAIGVGCVLLMAVIFLPSLSRAHESARRASCANNLKQMGLVFKMYANEDPHHLYPPLTAAPSVWMTDFQHIYPEFLTDPLVLQDPSGDSSHKTGERLTNLLAATPVDWPQVTRVASQDYVYLGWVVKTREDLDALVAARADPRFDPDAKSFTIDGRTLYRICEGVERFFVTDVNNPAASAKAQSEIPVMLCTTPHVPGGHNVLYLDGHVEFLRYGTFPVTRAVEQALGIRTSD